MSFVKKIVKKVKKSVAPALGGAGAGALIGSAVPGIGTLAGAGLGAAAGVGLSAMQDSQVKAQNKANKQAIDRANAYDMYTWDLANQYNNPKAQVQRLIDAGFNPYTPGAVSAGNASGVASSNGVAQQSVANKTALAMQLAQAGANLANTQANTDLLRNQGVIADKNADIASYQADYAQAEHDAWLDSITDKNPYGIPPSTWQQGGLKLGNSFLKSATGKDALQWIQSGVDWFNN